MLGNEAKTSQTENCCQNRTLAVQIGTHDQGGLPLRSGHKKGANGAEQEFRTFILKNPTSEKRFARTLLLLADYDAGSKNPSILSRINQDTLAEMLGTTRPRVNLFMNKFRKLGYTHYDKNERLEVYKSLAKALYK